MGKSRGRSYDDDDEWEDRAEKFNSRRQKRHLRDVSTVVEEMIREEGGEQRGKRTYTG